MIKLHWYDIFKGIDESSHVIFDRRFKSDSTK